MKRQIGDFFRLAGRAPKSATSDDSRSPLIIRRPQLAIATRASASEMEQLWTRVADTWEELGRVAPHHSVLTAEKFRPDVIDENIEDFWQSAHFGFAVMDDICVGAGIDYQKYKSCLDFGAGVGRMSMRFASVFERVYALDVSQPHLDIAARRAQEFGFNHVECRKVDTSTFSALPEFDFFYSSMVFQHNPPPIMRVILQSLISALAPGGAGVFQIPVYMTGYSFDVPTYLSTPSSEMEMHAFPQVELLQIIRDCGADIRQIREDDRIGNFGRWVSNTIAIEKPSI